MATVRSYGWDAWNGEIGVNDWDSTVTLAQSKDMILKIINWGFASNTGFALWDYRDHTSQSENPAIRTSPGDFDRILYASNYRALASGIDFIFSRGYQQGTTVNLALG